jgi:DHA2 family multidrug resistance protein
VAALNGEVTAQATMIAYLDNFHLMLILTIAVAFTLLFVRKPEGAKAPENVVLE